MGRCFCTIEHTHKLFPFRTKRKKKNCTDFQRMLRHLSHLDSNKNQAFKKIKLKNGMKEIEIFLFLMFCSLVAVFVVDFLG